MLENGPKKILITPLEKVVRAGEIEYTIALTSPDGITHEEAGEIVRELAEAVGGSSHEIIQVDPRKSEPSGKSTFGFSSWAGSAWQPEGIFKKPGSPSPSSLHPEQN